MNEIQERLKNLSSEQRTLLLKRLQQKNLLKEPKNAAEVTRIIRVARDQRLPLSFAQQRLWFLDQVGSGSAYNMPAALELRGILDVVALQRSLQEVVRRHESLRTTFAVEAGKPYQVIHATWDIDLPVIDLSDYPPATQQAAIARLTSTEATQPFDLSRDRLLRATLLHLGSTAWADELGNAATFPAPLPPRHAHYRLLLTLHHIAADGWSIGVLLRELTALYTAFSQGQPSPLPELPIQYADFALWQRDYLQGPVLERQLAYWANQLTDAPALLELPTDRPRPAVQSYRGAHYAFQLDATLTAHLKQLAQAHNATLFMVLLTAFNVLLARHSHQEDIVVGSPIANRTRTEIEGLIGFFVNTLVLRTRLEGNPAFSDLLAQVRQTTLEAYQHQDLPFEQLVNELGLERSLSYSPLFQVMLVLQNAARQEVALPGLTTTLQPSAFPFAKFDLTLSLQEGDAGLLGAFEYATDLFDEATIARLAGHFTVLLQAIVADPEQPIQHLPLLTATEYHQIVYDWNNTTVDFGPLQTIQVLFEQQVARTPEAVAVVMAEANDTLQVQRTPTTDEQPSPLGEGIQNPKSKIQNSLTYAELNTRANQLAHHLLELGVKPDTLVAVAMERSIEMVVSLLAVLKAGAAYVPIDPAYPPERIAYMLTDSAVPILLTQSHLPLAQREEASGQNGVVQPRHVLSVDTLTAQLARQPTHNPQPVITPDNLAYVIYTSGSTGQPKGVMIEHGNVFNYLQWCLWQYGVSTGCGTLLHSPLVFDLTITSVWSPLLAGNRIYLLPESKGIDLLAQSLCKLTKLSFVKLTPAHLQLLNHQLDGQQLVERTNAFIIGGEALHHSLVKPWLQFAPETRLINEYGPTETTVGCVVYTVTQADEEEWVKIGKPIANTRVYILGNTGSLVPIGVAGELYIGGVQLARGYLNRPELTAARFIKHPEFGRLYKTGDLCRWLPDGNIEYIGRTDFQVKLRGFRIELGEIENALLAHEGVSKGVVLAREDAPGDKRLVAYFVGDADSDTLRQNLAQRLPDYMAPTAFVHLNALPLTPNGKLDRKALPAPLNWQHRAADISFVPPRTATERAIAEIWSTLLGIEQIGLHDSFFELGGHSLLATQFVSRIRQSAGIDLPLRQLFETPTIAALADYLDTVQLLQNQPPASVTLPGEAIYTEGRL